MEVDYRPAYEFVVSLETYLKRPAHKMLAIGEGWPGEVRKHLRPGLHGNLVNYGKDPAGECCSPLNTLLLLVRLSPDGGSEAFLDWLGGLTVGEMYEQLASYLDNVPGNLGEFRDRTLRLLRAWYEDYFQSVDRNVHEILTEEAASRRTQVDRAGAREFVELATNGLYIETLPESGVILLVPQYHCRPFNLCFYHERLMLFFYSVETPPSPGEPAYRLTALTRSLADQNRLRLLRMIFQRPRTFMEITKQMEMAKSTIHYHLAVLRAAGLIRIHIHRADCETTRYSSRPEAIDSLSGQLFSFLQSR